MSVFYLLYTRYMSVNSYLLFLFISFVYSEIVFKLIRNIPVFSLSSLANICFCFVLAELISFLFSKMNGKLKKVFTSIILFINALYFSAQICVFSIYSFYFQFSVLKLADQAAGFVSDGIDVVKRNSLNIILMLIPFAIYLVIGKKLNSENKNRKLKLANVLLCAIAALTYFLLVFISPQSNKTLYSETYSSSSMYNCIERLGVINSGFIDTYKTVFNKSEEITLDNDSIDEPEPEPESEPQIVEYTYNVLDIDFNKLAETDNKAYAEISNYLASQSGTLKNEYTGIFEGKNLILFMAESFNSICVSKELTPTLYKMIHSSFEFTNFYTPTNLSTIGGEFAELTGLIQELDDYRSTLSIFRAGQIDFPFGVANVFKQLGYSTNAYHDYDYDFQDRNVYIPSLGFDSYKALYYGLDVDYSIWPRSDIEMIEKTVDEYINDDNFMVFYATVSGHGSYWFDTQYNDIALKYEDIVRAYYGDSLGNDDSAEKLMAYVAGQIELDRALELLLQKLEAAGRLDDTVIVLAGDHAPYYLTNTMSNKDYNRLSTYYRDGVFEIYHSNLIIYNSEAEHVEIEKVGATMDIMPTVYNLFGIEYDSRLFVGKDILSSYPGIAIMGDDSWVSDYGTYNANTKTYTNKEGYSLTDDYAETVNKQVSNMQKISKLIARNNYYKYVWENK